MRTKKLALPALFGAVLFFVPDTAGAHGRLPRATRIFFAPDGSLLARTTFGLLISRDGSLWDLVCGKAVGFDVVEDPVYAADADGAFYATTANGLSISRDGACSWNTASAGAGSPFVDVTSDGHVALSSRYAPTDGAGFRYETNVWSAGASVGA
jgi:hypothetical protein